MSTDPFDLENTSDLPENLQPKTSGPRNKDLVLEAVREGWNRRGRPVRRSEVQAYVYRIHGKQLLEGSATQTLRRLQKENLIQRIGTDYQPVFQNG